MDKLWNGLFSRIDVMENFLKEVKSKFFGKRSKEGIKRGRCWKELIETSETEREVN